MLLAAGIMGRTFDAYLRNRRSLPFMGKSNIIFTQSDHILFSNCYTAG